MGARQLVLRLAVVIITALWALPVQAQSSELRQNISFTTNRCEVMPIKDMGTGVWQVTGTFTAVVTWTVSVDNATWLTIDAFSPDTPSTAANSTTDTAGGWSASVAGYRYMRTCITSFSAGPVVVSMSATSTGGGGGGGGGGAASTITSLEDGFGENVGDDANNSIQVTCVSGCSSATSFDLDTGAGTENVSGASLRIGASGGSIPITAAAGAVAAGTPRVTLGSDDPAVVALQIIDNAISGAGFNITQLGGAAVPIGAGTEAAAIRVTLPTNGTGVVTANLSATDNAVLDAIESDTSALAAGITIVTNAAPVASDVDLGNVDLELAGTAVSHTNRLPTCLSDGVSACVTITANPADEAAFTYTATQTVPFGAVAESTSDALADGTVGAVNMTLARQLFVSPRSAGSGGGQPIVVVSNSGAADDEDEHAVCDATCTVYSVVAFNHAAASAFLRCENDTIGNTTPGSETAGNNEINLEIPGNTAGAGFAINFGSVGVAYATALTCWIVTEEAASGTTDVGTDDVRVVWVRGQV